MCVWNTSQLFFAGSFVSEDKRWLDVSQDSDKALSLKMNMLCRAVSSSSATTHCTSTTGGVTNDKTCDSRSVGTTEDVLMLGNSEQQRSANENWKVLPTDQSR